MRMLSVAILTLAFGLTNFAAPPSRDRLDESFGPLFKAANFQKPSKGPRKGVDALRRWSTITIDASGYDHGDAREQLGPGRAARAVAITHIAMYDVVVGVHGKFESYSGLR